MGAEEGKEQKMKQVEDTITELTARHMMAVATVNRLIFSPLFYTIITRLLELSLDLAIRWKRVIDF